ncbi:guanosine-5'-triphosphate,3'-diphosphate pyrophosphatase [Bowmanella sp. JS7-9]|uniref:Ppx/GppA phosphatase family protein n=1 Tax=Alteromonadaceae TaxID=72275 RepID=UPI0010E699DC|nr:guanosine-5'-triphosphate,3'-diphosphate pyrophosphatase [Bowmanella sp. JS7-9]TBX23807.1 guanosine-3',5'-bis(diphosphate) 3'-pyrophosphohydrolase [Bowmanella sp. JS7-9]
MRDVVPLAPQPEEYYAAIDLGSNSFHMVVIKVVAGSVHIVGKVKQKIRLAAGLDENMNLDEASMQRGWECLEAFSEWLADIPKQNQRVVATATLRLARNAEEFIARGRYILGCDINVISGEEEARQIYLGVAYTSQTLGHTLVIDIGGASTEIVVGEGFDPKQLTSLNMGCVTYLERYFSDGLLSQSNFDAAIAAAKENIQPVAEMFLPYDWQQCMGASGTPQAIVEILVSQGINDSIRLSYLHELMQQCISIGRHKDLNIEGLDESRKQPFPSGLAILIALFECLNIDEMQISGGALREGLIYGMLETREQHNVRVQTINSITQRFDIDACQAERVEELAKALFKQVPKSFWLAGFDACGVLDAAARLHEIGTHIEYKNSHLHGAYILNYLDMPGFTRLQRDVIRDLVHNYRQSIDVKLLNGYQPRIRNSLTLLTRLLRVAVILCIRRSGQRVPVPKLSLEGDGTLQLQFEAGWLARHPLIRIELANEAWLQHRAGWIMQVS